MVLLNLDFDNPEELVEEFIVFKILLKVIQRKLHFNYYFMQQLRNFLFVGKLQMHDK